MISSSFVVILSFLCMRKFIIITLSGFVARFTGQSEEMGRPKLNENQIIVRCKQPIKIEKAFLCLLSFSYNAGETNILQTVLLSFLFQFLFSQCPPK